jgi:hypothetical protein
MSEHAVWGGGVGSGRVGVSKSLLAMEGEEGGKDRVESWDEGMHAQRGCSVGGEKGGGWSSHFRPMHTPSTTFIPPPPPHPSLRICPSRKKYFLPLTIETIAR